MKFRFLMLFILLFFSFSNIMANTYYRYTSVIDTQTGYTIEQGMFQLSMMNYNDGGVELKAFAGLTERIFFGVSLDIEHLIGNQKIEPNVPGVIFKWRLTDGWDNWPISFALGYDSFYMGNVGKADNNKNSRTTESNYNYSKFNRMIYGPYFVITKPLYAFNSEQHFNFGFRLPAQPDFVPVESTYFVSLDIPLGAYWVIKGELQRIYWDFSRMEQILANIGVRYNVVNNISLDFSLRFEKDENVNRVIKLEYNNAF